MSVIHLRYSYYEVIITSVIVSYEKNVFASREIKVLSVTFNLSYGISWDMKCTIINWTAPCAFGCSCMYMTTLKIMENFSKDPCHNYLQTNKARSSPQDCANTLMA